MVTSLNSLTRKLQECAPAPMFSFPLGRQEAMLLDLSASNARLKEIDYSHVPTFERFIWEEIRNTGARVAVGGYGEKRYVYAQSEVFAGGEEVRCFHLGVDVWVEAETRVFAPLDGRIHSFKDNANYLDYGPTIIVEHDLGGEKFYSLYGHLTVDSLDGLEKGKFLAAGAEVGRVGNYPLNGDWPPHLHFQLMRDMQGLEGDFPGVAAPSKLEYYLELCPDPNLLLRCPALERESELCG